ncbi:hypothetical protein ACFQ09_11435 [Massilia norwichensis]|uniref:Uncharacterized protein n=1 Tax=Massilia norwichensis TaxID=1442366 RepID=A0ABT2AAX1_9BURK|nr:hypothetical protein [Massilia norwichensis]MCS0591349.1 hypothetical protein [Massilia norwichensis]
MSELEFEQENEPERAFEEARVGIAMGLRRLVTQGLNEQLDEQAAKGLEPETNGMSVLIMRTAGKNSSRAVLAAGHVFEFKVAVAAMNPKTQEGPTGADIAIFLEVLPQSGAYIPILSKTLLIQAKVGKLNAKGELSASDQHLPGQIAQIQRVSPNDGFLLVYTDQGAYCIEIAEATRRLNGNTVRTTHFSDAGEMLYRMVICTSGNEPSIAPSALGPRRDTLGSIEVADAAQRLANVARIRPVEEAIGITLTVADGNP